MTAKTSISTTKLKNRRDELKNKRRWRDSVSVIRSLLIMSFTGGIFWFLTLPNWVIKDSQQIKIQGNNLLTDNEIRGLIPLKYPQSLLKLSVIDLTQGLQKKVPLANVVVIRELLPPNLTIKVTEKKPVAIAFAMEISPKTKKAELKQVGYIDADGVFVSNELYQNLAKQPELKPSLKILGIPQTYLAYWADFYSLLNQSAVKINEIDWQNPTNIILTTELGKVYLGPYTSKFSQQLMILEKLKNIGGKIPKERIIYIDLTDPEMPSVKEKEPPKKENKDKKN
ncbi:cell division protein FtsQ/DivIB [Geminocystis sp. NIES-3709]|uniref:cell division protein FtsQ/DivIB n=1 Tax=Geminocystis sp. NIES-3709 TaxID=1617448 RepID=UPI0005FC474E|nr:FtsQ-type POTRA domain-containing protein [Geminocystis sp. NIES-3709]BAQ65444.1 cell division protein FtsQ [Geminocystis sp. NIES-3709]